MRKYIIVSYSYPYEIEKTEYLSFFERKFIRHNTRFFYDDNSTIKELFIYIARNLRNAYYKRGECSKENIYKYKYLIELHRYKYNDTWIKIFDLNTKISTVVSVNGINFNLLLYALVDKGGCIDYDKGIRYYMNSKESGEHHLPHVHVEYGGKQVSISLNGKILAGGISKKKQKEAVDRIVSNKESFLFKWNTMTDGKKYIFDNDVLVGMGSEFK